MKDNREIIQEKIGSVVMDFTYYAGKDLYSDGAIEDEMLEIAMNHAPESFPKIIEEKKAGRFFIIFLRFEPTLSTGFHLKRRIRC